MADYKTDDPGQWMGTPGQQAESLGTVKPQGFITPASAVPNLNVLAEAAAVVSGDRQKDYGHPRENHQATADFFNAYLRRRYGADAPTLDARAVCMLNALQKISRDANRPKRDNLVDVAGYMRNAEMVDEVEPW